jgi:hypothetical protein
VDFFSGAAGQSGAVTRPTRVRMGKRPLKILTILDYTESVRGSK